MEGQDPPPQVVEIDDPEIPQHPSLAAPEVLADLDVPIQVSTLAAELPRISTRVRSQPDTYTPSMTGKRYEYAMTQLEIQGVLHTDSHIFAQEYFYQAEPGVVISIMNQLSLKAGLKEWGENATNLLESLMINKTIGILLKQQWSPLMRTLLKI